MTSEAVRTVIVSIKDHRRRFEAFCRSLSEEELQRPVPETTWVVKDFVSHLASFDIEMARWTEALIAGRLNEAINGNSGKPFDVDEWNDARIAERRALPLVDVLAEAARNRAALIDALERLDDQQIAGTVHFPGDNKRDPADVPFSLFLGGWARHDPIHVADMLKALPERATDPTLQEWLNDSIVQWYQTTMAGPPKR